MNITLSADDATIQRTREYAARHGTSLNQLLREHMERLAGMADVEQVAEEFTHLATTRAGCSPEGFVFDRDEAHRRVG